MTHTDGKRLRRLALEITIQLPEDREEALKVLKYSEQLISGFLEDAPQEKRGSDVFSLVHSAPPGG